MGRHPNEFAGVAVLALSGDSCPSTERCGYCWRPAFERVQFDPEAGLSALRSSTYSIFFTLLLADSPRSFRKPPGPRPAFLYLAVMGCSPAQYPLPGPRPSPRPTKPPRQQLHVHYALPDQHPGLPDSRSRTSTLLGGGIILRACSYSTSASACSHALPFPKITAASWLQNMCVYAIAYLCLYFIRVIMFVNNFMPMHNLCLTLL